MVITRSARTLTSYFSNCFLYASTEYSKRWSVSYLNRQPLGLQCQREPYGHVTFSLTRRYMRAYIYVHKTTATKLSQIASVDRQSILTPTCRDTLYVLCIVILVSLSVEIYGLYRPTYNLELTCLCIITICISSYTSHILIQGMCSQQHYTCQMHICKLSCCIQDRADHKQRLQKDIRHATLLYISRAFVLLSSLYI